MPFGAELREAQLAREATVRAIQTLDDTLADVLDATNRVASSSKRLEFATWMLVGLTVVLAALTAVLVLRVAR